jgi:hypothetical protein
LSDHRDHEAAWSGLCPSGQHGLDYRGQICDLCRSTFAVWPKARSDSNARTIRAPTAKQAAEQRAREDWLAGATTWPTTYCARDGLTGNVWVVDVTIAMEPSFIAFDARVVPMPPATHVLWGGRALCEDKRLRGVPRDWPVGHRWISLKDVADGVAAPPDRCAACWTKAPGLVEGLRQIGSVR